MMKEMPVIKFNSDGLAHRHMEDIINWDKFYNIITNTNTDVINKSVDGLYLNNLLEIIKTINRNYTNQYDFHISNIFKHWNVSSLLLCENILIISRCEYDTIITLFELMAEHLVYIRFVRIMIQMIKTIQQLYYTDLDYRPQLDVIYLAIKVIIRGDPRMILLFHDETMYNPIYGDIAYNHVSELKLAHQKVVRMVWDQLNKYNINPIHRPRTVSIIVKSVLENYQYSMEEILDFELSEMNIYNGSNYDEWSLLPNMVMINIMIWANNRNISSDFKTWLYDNFEHELLYDFVVNEG